MPARRPVRPMLRDDRFDSVHYRRRPRPLHRVINTLLDEPVGVAASCSYQHGEPGEVVNLDNLED